MGNRTVTCYDGATFALRLPYQIDIATWSWRTHHGNVPELGIEQCKTKHPHARLLSWEPGLLG
jgi:hypothetical protein